jgi:hypothetical protein
MIRLVTPIAAVVLLAFTASSSIAQSDSKKMPTKRLTELKKNWAQNKPKLTACRTEARRKGLAGDDRWFFIEDCMGKS